MDSTKKRCKDCGRAKKKSEFYVNKVVTLATGETSTYHSPYCTPCHKRRTRDEKRRVQDENLLRIWRYLEEHPCIVCGETNPVMLSFDHREGHAKVAAMSNLMRHRWEVIEVELAKCDVLCHNHHAVKTAAQLNWFRAPLLRDYVESWPENRAAYRKMAKEAA